MGKSDASYRQLLAHPQLLHDLLACIMDAGWLGHLDWPGLEAIDTHYVGARLQQRAGDGAWRIPYHSSAGDLYLLLMLENQSRPDAYMALRMATYAGLLYQTLLGRKTVRLPLPPILPVVLYSGRRSWHAQRALSELIDPRVPELSTYQPQMRYLLIDEAALLRAGGLPEYNLAGLLFRLEHSRRIEQILELLHTLIQVLNGPEFEELDRAFTAYVQDLVLSRAQPLEPAPVATNLRELVMLISEKPGMWARQWEREGIRKGRKEGREEGAAALLQTLLQRKFGVIPEWAADRVAHADTKLLQQWALNVLDAQSLEDVFGNR